MPINVFFSYSFIFGKFGMPELGGAGNAIAVAVTYTVLFFYSIIYNFEAPRKINKI